MSPNPAGAIIGAVVGTVNASIQCTAPGGGGYGTSLAVEKATTGSADFNGAEFALSLFVGGVTGAATGALSSALSYNLSDSYKDNILGKIEDYGIKENRIEDVMNFDMENSGVQRAIDFYAQKVRGYTDINFEYDAISNGGTRGEMLPDRSGIKIYDAALSVDGQKDATSLMATIDHEHNHFEFNDMWKAEAQSHGFNDFTQKMNKFGMVIRGNGSAFVEARNYHLGLTQGTEYGYSQNVMDYLKISRDANMNWQSRTIMVGY